MAASDLCSHSRSAKADISNVASAISFGHSWRALELDMAERYGCTASDQRPFAVGSRGRESFLYL
jgi:hypothetical protein